MKLLILAVGVSVGWMSVLILALRSAIRHEPEARPRLFVGSGLAIVAVALWFAWFQVRFLVHPLDFVGHWKLLGLCLVGMAASIASALSAPKALGATRTAWMVCALVMVGVFLLTAIVSAPVS